jgi:hypothetical protein
MKRFTIPALALIVLTGAATTAQAQAVTGRGTAGMCRPSTIAGSGVGRNENTRAESAKEKSKRERKDKADPAAEKEKAAKKELDDHKGRMKQDNDARGQAEYVEGWVRYDDGRRVDEKYKELAEKHNAAKKAAAAAKKLYEDTP